MQNAVIKIRIQTFDDEQLGDLDRLVVVSREVSSYQEALEAFGVAMYGIWPDQEVETEVDDDDDDDEELLEEDDEDDHIDDLTYTVSFSEPLKEKQRKQGIKAIMDVLGLVKEDASNVMQEGYVSEVPEAEAGALVDCLIELNYDVEMVSDDAEDE